MKWFLVFLRVAVVGIALLAGGRALYHNRDKLKRDWRTRVGSEGLRSLIGKLSMSRLRGHAGSFKALAGRRG